MIKNIHILGATSLTGQYLCNDLKRKVKNINIFCYSSNSSKYSHLDLTKNIYNLKNPHEDHIIISVSPIWIFSKFIYNSLNLNPLIKNKLKGIITCSSSSLITKKYASNYYDKHLVYNLKYAEDNLKKICTENNIFLSIIRPTLIYGKRREKIDNNINLIIKILRLTPFIIFPKNSGLRQPIHAKQLSEVFINIFFKMIKNKSRKIYILNIGGDQEMNYFEMIKRVQNKLDKDDPARNTIILKIPNKLFYFIISPLIIFSEKNYEAILRINSNLANFTKVFQLTGKRIQKFPIKPYY